MTTFTITPERGWSSRVNAALAKAKDGDTLVAPTDNIWELAMTIYRAQFPDKDIHIELRKDEHD